MTRSRAGVGSAQGLLALQIAACPLVTGPMAATPAVPAEGGKYRLLPRLGSCTAAGVGSPSGLSEALWDRPLPVQNRTQNRIRGTAQAA